MSAAGFAPDLDSSPPRLSDNAVQKISEVMSNAGGNEERQKKPIATNLRSWRVIIMRSKGEHIGSVEASGRERAEAVAVKRFDLGRDQYRRLLIRERLLSGSAGGAFVFDEI